MLVLRVGNTPFCKSGNDLAVLRQHGVRTELAESGRDALDFLRLYEYDLGTDGSASCGCSGL